MAMQDWQVQADEREVFDLLVAHVNNSVTRAMDCALADWTSLKRSRKRIRCMWDIQLALLLRNQQAWFLSPRGNYSRPRSQSEKKARIISYCLQLPPVPCSMETGVQYWLMTRGSSIHERIVVSRIWCSERIPPHSQHLLGCKLDPVLYWLDLWIYQQTKHPANSWFVVRLDLTCQVNVFDAQSDLGIIRWDSCLMFKFGAVRRKRGGSRHGQPKFNKPSSRLNSTLRHGSNNSKTTQYVLPELRLWCFLEILQADLGFEFSKTIELLVRDRNSARNFRSSRPSLQLVFDALPFYSSKEFDKFDKLLSNLNWIRLSLENTSYNYPRDHSFNQTSCDHPFRAISGWSSSVLKQFQLKTKIN